MTLANIAAKIRELPGEAGGTVTWKVGPWNLTFQVEKHDQWSCLLHEIHGQHESSATFPWRKWADALPGKVRSLGDPLKVLEVDAQQNATMLRSAHPHRQDDITTYFELLARQDGSFSLRRYQGAFDPKRERQPVPFAITYESLTRCVQEMVGG